MFGHIAVADTAIHTIQLGLRLAEISLMKLFISLI